LPTEPRPCSLCRVVRRHHYLSIYRALHGINLALSRLLGAVLFTPKTIHLPSSLMSKSLSLCHFATLLRSLAIVGSLPLSLAQAQGDPLARVRAATVHISVQGVSGGATGSGVLLSETGLIVTNAHVIAGAHTVSVKLASGETFEAAGAQDYDPRLDLALIVIPGFGLPQAELGNSDSIAVGDRLFAVGAPLGLEQTVTDGILSAVRIDNGVRRLQTSTPVAPGSSGGPLTDTKGRVVGIIVSGIRGNGAENLNFAIPINVVRGKVALLAGRAFTPFTQLAYAPGDNTGSPGVLGASAASAPNSGLNLKFESLEGVNAYSEQPGDKGWSFKTTTKYATSRTPSGELTIERYSTTVGRVKVNMLRSEDAQVENTRTVLEVSSLNRSSTDYELRHFYDSGYNRSSSLLIQGTRYRYSVAGNQSEGDAPQGIFPPEMLNAVIAALPEDLQSETHFWVLDPSANRAAEVVVKVSGRDSTDIRVPSQGTVCGQDVLTSKVKVPVLKLSIKATTTTMEQTVLATQPHVRVDGAKCVAVPGLGSR
jgi:S1-C subfamily serine protease